LRKAPPLDEDVLRIVGEVNKKRKGGRDEDAMGEILFKISDNFVKFKQVRLLVQIVPVYYMYSFVADIAGTA
jgi:hypothetical protein